MNNALVERLARRFLKLEADRSECTKDLQEICEFLLPERAKFFTGAVKSTSSERSKIFDSTPEDAHQILSAALQSIMTPASQTWIILALLQNNDSASSEVKEWIDEVVKRMMAKFNSEEGGFHSAVHEFYMEYCGLGTACFFVDEIDEVIRFQSIPLSEIYVSENNRGIIDTVYRKFDMTARQIQQYKKWTIPVCVKEALEKDPDQKFSIIHAIEPRESFKKDAIAGRDMEVLSCHFLLQSKEILCESGYQEMPAMVSRWTKSAGQVMGRGVGHRALPDTRVLNEMNRSALIAGERSADPITLLPHDGFIGEFSSDGGATNYYRGSGGISDKVMTLGSDADLNAIMLMIDRRQGSIRKMFMNDQLQPFDKVQMTATEYSGNQVEKMRILGPVAGRSQTEFLGPLAKRVFNIMLRNNEFPPVPEELNGTPLKVQYVSPISRAQKQTEAEAFTQAINYMAPVVQVSPQVLENFDFDAVARDTQEMFGFPAKYMKSPERLKKEREAAAQAQAKQAEMVAQSQELTLKGQAKEVNAPVE